MNQHPQYRSYTFSIAPGGVYEIARQAQFFTCIEATAPFKVAFNDAPKTDFLAGLSFEASTPFNKVRIENDGAADLTITAGLGVGGIRDARFVSAAPIETKPIARPDLTTNAPVSVPAGQVVQIAADDTARHEIGMRNLNLTERVWVQGSPTAAASGFPLDGKEVAILTTSAAVHVYNPSGVAIEIATFEIGGL